MQTYIGSLSGQCLNLYTEKESDKAYIIVIPDRELRWSMYCNHVDLNWNNKSKHCTIKFKDKIIIAPIWEVALNNVIEKTFQIAENQERRE